MPRAIVAPPGARGSALNHAFARRSEARVTPPRPRNLCTRLAPARTHRVPGGIAAARTGVCALARPLLPPTTMNPNTLETFRRDLIKRGRSVLRRRKHALADEEQLLSEREPDWEDRAADESAAAVLDRLGEAERTALARIEASLARMKRGTYGVCMACGGPIDLDRLRAVPEADRCAGCMESH